MTSSSPAVIPAAERPEDILEALLFAVSHDLRSPLLTLSLSADLIRESMHDTPEGPGGGSTAVALNALKQGAEDLERMLKALATLSRARRREQAIMSVPLRTLLGGHVVIADVADVEQVRVSVDSTAVRELMDCLCGEDPAEIRLTLTDTHAWLRIPACVELPALAGSPLIELAGSLTVHAGTVVETLASLQVQLARQGASIEVDAQTVNVWLPLAAGGAR